MFWQKRAFAATFLYLCRFSETLTQGRFPHLPYGKRPCVSRRITFWLSDLDTQHIMTVATRFGISQQDLIRLLHYPLTPAVLRVYVYLLGCSFRDDAVTVKYRTIADRCHFSDHKTAVAAISELKNQRLVSRFHRCTYGNTQKILPCSEIFPAS